MTEQHPITPPEQLLRTWRERQFYAEENINVLLTAAYQAGADHELEACCEWLETYVQRWAEWSTNFRVARRPKRPSVKEQALLAIDTAVADGRLSSDVSNVVRRALEQLDD
jgi:hypothetical protein